MYCFATNAVIHDVGFVLPPASRGYVEVLLNGRRVSRMARVGRQRLTVPGGIMGCRGFGVMVLILRNIC